MNPFNIFTTSIFTQGIATAHRFLPGWLSVSIHVLLILACLNEAKAETLAEATFDVDVYIYMGTTHDPGDPINQELPGLALGTDVSQTVLRTHFPFALVKFDDLNGLDTRANGGPHKYLTLTTHYYPGPATIAVSVAQADITSPVDGIPVNPAPYFSLFPGNPTGEAEDRLQWYFDNIKGDNPTYGGYAGGAPHVGIIEVTDAGQYSIDVTDVVDAWLDGSANNYGFGLWGIYAPGGACETIEFASRDNPAGNGPTLESLPVGGVLPGDFDMDGDVDGNDFLAWQSGFGIQEGAVPADGDANGDGRVDRDDYLVWEGNFGLSTESGTNSAGTGLSGAGISRVPEPSAAGLALLLLAAGSIGLVFRLDGPFQKNCAR